MVGGERNQQGDWRGGKVARGKRRRAGDDRDVGEWKKRVKRERDKKAVAEGR